MNRLRTIIKILLVAGGLAAAGYFAAWLVFSLRPAAAVVGEPHVFKVAAGAGFQDIARSLESARLIRSRAAFQTYAFLAGRARNLKPGRYAISPAYSGAAVSAILAAGPEVETTVTIPEGVTMIGIDKILSEHEVTSPGEFLAYVKAQDRPIEGHLFPETYRFYFDSNPRLVLDRFLAEFEKRAAPILSRDPANAERNLILASILEKEIPNQEEQKIAAGLLIKRVKAGVPLQVDAGICYAKEALAPDLPCEPITRLDKKIDSPYNTYLHSGWPPGPISNPGILALEAALDPKDSPYWYYLSDPRTRKTIFAKTIEEQLMNQLKYLNND